MLGRPLHLLARYLLPQWPAVVVLAALLFGGIALQLAAPRIARSFLDTAVAGGAVAGLVRTAALYCLAGLGGQALAVLTTYVGANVGWMATNNLRADLAEHCLQLDMPFHHAHTPGELIERLDGDVGTLGNFFSKFALLVLGNLLLMAGVLLLLLWEDWRIGAVFAGFMIATLVVLGSVRNAATPFWRAGRQASADLYGFVEERIDGIADLRTAGATAYVQRRFAEAARAHFRRGRAATFMAYAVGSGAELLLTLGSVGALAVGAALYQAGSLTIGTVYLITAYAALLTRPLQELINQIDDLQKAAASIARIAELAQLRPAVVDGSGAELPAGAPAVAFENVSFGYNGLAATPTVARISFELAPGEVLGLLGRTGSGKTTLARLLLRLYDPVNGRITLGGTDIRAARLGDLRRRIGVVTQDVQLFRASVRDNLTLFDSTLPDPRIVEVIRDLGLDAWFAALPRGLDTLLPPGGGLSAGQAQLLAVARIFLRDPGLVILDEASSRLDPATERLLDRALDRLFAGRTAIIIAHRLRTVARADRILILERGRVRENGRREALVRDPHSYFAQLLRVGLEDVLE